MIKGELSNQPSNIILVDWKIIIDPKVSLSKLSSEVFHNYSLFFLKKPEEFFPIKKNAKGWLSRNWEHRFCAYTISLEEPFRIIVEPILQDLVAELEHFEDRKEFRQWLKVNTQVLYAITPDKEILGMDETVKEFLGWGSISEYV